MTATVGSPVAYTDTASSSAVSTLVSPALAVGEVFVVATARSNATGTNNGVASIDADTNTEQVNVSHANRSLSVDVSLSFIPVTDAFEASENVVVTYNSGINRRLGIGVPVSGLAGTKQANSSFTLGVGETSTGSNGRGTSVSGGSVTTTGAALIFWAVGFGGNGTTITTPSGLTLVTKIGTTIGASDRNLALFHQEVASAGTYSMPAATLSGSTDWAVCAAAFDLSAAAAVTREVKIGGTFYPVTLRQVVI